MGRHHQHAHPEVVDLRAGDVVEQLRTLPDNSLHAIITDPPYGLAEHRPDAIAQTLGAWLAGQRDAAPTGRGFMGRSWDAFVPPPAVWDECLRVLRPGGHLAVFAGSRTVDLMGLSIRLAGFEVRDTLSAWLYGSGFPKSLDVGKAIDKAAGAAREVIGHGENYGASTAAQGKQAFGDYAGEWDITAPATDDARTWDGWGTALKPAHEPILIARKPLAGTVAQTVLAHGAGAINVDACRVATSDVLSFGSRAIGTAAGIYGQQHVPHGEGEQNAAGRWPTNVVLAHHPDCGPDEAPGPCVPDCQVAALDEQSGATTSSARPRHNRDHVSGSMAGPLGAKISHGFEDSGGASRFFPTFRYQAKAPTRERPQAWGRHIDCACPTGRPFDLETGALPPTWRRGAVCSSCERPASYRGHPTVKPLGLVAWLLDLLVVPGGLVADVFAGSGPLGQAVVERGDGTRAVLIERDPHHVELIRQRLDGAQPPAPPAPEPAPVLELALTYSPADVPAAA